MDSSTVKGEGRPEERRVGSRTANGLRGSGGCETPQGGSQPPPEGFRECPVLGWRREEGPFLIGTLGLVEGRYPEYGLSDYLFCVCLDYLSVSTSGAVGAELLKLYPHFVELGGRWAGCFQNAERMQEGSGVTVTRRWEAYQGSKRFGEDFENWEASGVPARSFGLNVIGMDVAPTRMDFAFDYPCEPTLCPVDVAESLVPGVRAYLDRPLAEPKPSTLLGEPGSNGRHTRTVYFGNQGAEFRVCIYRRDLRKDNGWGVPVVRVELRFRHRLAEGFWPLWTDSAWRAFRGASEYFRERCGVRLCAERGEIPERAPQEKPAAVGGLARCCKQYLGTLRVLLEDKLLPHGEMKLLLAEVESRVSKSTRYRMKANRRVMEAMGSEELMNHLRRSLLGGGE